MTQAAVPPVPPSAGRLLGMMDPRDAEECLKEVAKIGSDRISVYVETGLRIYGFKKPPPAERLFKYRERSKQPRPNRWDLLERFLPRVYHEQMRDWRDLEDRFETDDKLQAAVKLVEGIAQAKAIMAQKQREQQQAQAQQQAAPAAPAAPAPAPAPAPQAAPA